MRIGSLFSGAGGLDMAVQAVFGGQVLWHSEIDKAASKVLAHRYPDVPNLGDITQINLAYWKPMLEVDVLCGGFPCQDVSAAGKRAGIKDGTRSGLWAVFAEAIDILRPQWVVIENVRGLLSAAAHRTVEDDAGDYLEPDPSGVGDGAGRPVLRAAGAVLGDLADIGYDAVWATVAAADVGAPHRRERVFVLAANAGNDGRPGEANHPRWRQSDVAGSDSGCESSGLGKAFTSGAVGAVSGDEPGVALPPTPRASDPANASSHSSDGFRPQLGEVVRQFGGERRSECGEVVNDDGAVPVLPADGGGDDTVLVASNGEGVAVDVSGCVDSHIACLPVELAGTKHHDLLPTPAASDGARGPDYAATERNSSSYHTMVTLAAINQWGKYAPAIARWEAIVGPAPAPTEPNKNGNPRLSAAFSEWLMGWPAGWVTDPAIGISRNDQLRIVGNGVCPQQATAALHYLLDIAVAA